MEHTLEESIVRTLAHLPLDYGEHRTFICEERRRGIKWAKAGVLVLLGRYSSKVDSESNYFFLLNKRSQDVQQPGDLCYPGGHPNHWIDLVSSRFFVPHILPLRKNSGFKMNRKLNREYFRTITYILGNVLREGFKEIRLNPFKVDFLGPLQCYRLERFHRIIFPMVGMMRQKSRLKPNWEVEKILRIQLTSLFNHEKHANYRLKVTGEFRELFGEEWIDNECFIHQREGQPDEILWGATYKITMSFLKAVFNFDPPDNSIRPVVEGELYPEVS